MKRTSKFSYKNVDMLIAARTVVKNFEDHKAELIAMRSNWQDPFIGDLKTRINDAISNYLGRDAKKDLKLATLSVTEIQETSLKNLSVFKVQLEVDFSDNKPRLEFLLDNLGFTRNYVAARKGDQEGLIELLFSFKENMITSLKNELISKGIQAQLIDNIKGAAVQLRDANVDQENLKDVSKELTAEAIEEFNAIYKEVMAVCRISAKLFKENPAKKNKFTFSRIAKRLNHTRGIEKPDIRRGIEGIENQIINPDLDNDTISESPPEDLSS